MCEELEEEDLGEGDDLGAGVEWQLGEGHPCLGHEQRWESPVEDELMQEAGPVWNFSRMLGEFLKIWRRGDRELDEALPLNGQEGYSDSPLQQQLQGGSSLSIGRMANLSLPVQSKL
jgi:hypothetical protein